MTRLGKIGFVGFLLAGVGWSACSQEALRRSPDGLYQKEGITSSICLYMSDGGSQLTKDLACDLSGRGTGHSYEILGGNEAGTDQDGGPCGFDYSHDQPVPITGGSTFEIASGASSGSGDEVFVTGTFDGDAATGTSTKVSGLSRCEIEWTAPHVNGGTGGTGGAGGDAGDGGTGGEDPVVGLEQLPDCTAGEPHDFGDGTFGSGWVDKLTETSPPESTYATRQAEEGGNPGRYHSIDLSNGTSTLGTSTCVVSFNDDARYDPTQMGPYTKIYMRLQASTPGSEFSSLQTRFSVVVKQGDDLYWSGPESIMVKFADGWVDKQIDETQLRLWPSYDSPQAPARDGEELSFGFITCVNGTREDSAVDNFIVRVCDTKEP